MSSVPVEFDPVHVAANAAADLPMYRDELASKDPMHSVLDANPEIYFVPPKRSSEWGQWDLNRSIALPWPKPFWRTKSANFARTLGTACSMSIGGTAKLITRCQRNK